MPAKKRTDVPDGGQGHGKSNEEAGGGGRALPGAEEGHESKDEGQDASEQAEDEAQSEPMGRHTEQRRSPLNRCHCQCHSLLVYALQRSAS